MPKPYLSSQERVYQISSLQSLEPQYITYKLLPRNMNHNSATNLPQQNQQTLPIHFQSFNS